MPLCTTPAKLSEVVLVRERDTLPSARSSKLLHHLNRVSLGSSLSFVAADHAPMTARNIVGKCFPLVSCRAPPTKSRLGVDVLFRETYATVTGGYMSQGFKALKVIFFGGSHWANADSLWRGEAPRRTNCRFQFNKRAELSSARTIKRFPSSRCASTIQIVCPLELMVETQPQLQPALLGLSAMISQLFTNIDCASLRILLRNDRCSGKSQSNRTTRCPENRKCL